VCGKLPRRENPASPRDHNAPVAAFREFLCAE
jgi:hypothetical protein